MKIKFLEFKTLEDGSALTGIDIYDDEFYFLSESFDEVSVADKNWKITETIPLEHNAVGGDTSFLKPSLFIKENKQPGLLILKSGRGEGNNEALLLNLKSKAVDKIDLTVFYNRLRQLGIDHLDLASATMINDKIALCNQGADELSPDNRIFFTSCDFWKKQAGADVFKAKVLFEQLPGINPTVTAITYSYANDWLIIAAAAGKPEGEAGSGDDFDSYIAVVENAYRKLDRKRLRVNEVVNLSKVDRVLENQLIQSISIQADKEQKLKLHMIAKDNTGTSYLLKVRIKAG